MTRWILLLCLIALTACAGEASIEGRVSDADVRKIKAAVAEITDSAPSAIRAKGDRVRVTTRDGQTITLRQFQGRWMQSEESGKTIFD